MANNYKAISNWQLLTRLIINFEPRQPTIENLYIELLPLSKVRYNLRDCYDRDQSFGNRTPSTTTETTVKVFCTRPKHPVHPCTRRY